jgi:hypothetical protein
MANTYSVGTVAVTNGSKTVTITGGLFISINVKAGDQIGIAGGLLNAIDTLTDATHLELVRAWDGATGAGLTYIVWHMPSGWGDRVELNEAVAENIRLLGLGIPFTAEQLAAANAAAASAEASMVSASQSEAYAEIAAGTATDKAAQATAAIDIVVPAKDIVVAEAAAANADADRAELARDGALAGGTIYPDLATGRAAVADNAYFKVLGSGDVSFRLYKRLTAGTQVLVMDQPSAFAISSKIAFETGFGLLFSIIDSARRRSWVEAAGDGGPTDWTMSHLFRRIDEKRFLPTLQSAPGILAAITDSNGLLTDVTLDGKTGQIADWVMARWAARLAPLLELDALDVPVYPWPHKRGSTMTIKGSDTYLRGEEVLPIFPDMTRIAGWGSSTMAGLFSRLQTWAASLGATYFNGAQGGEYADATTARLGSHPALLSVAGGQIPASGSVVVTASNMVPDNSLKPFTGTWNGVAGTLSSTATVISFARTTAGTAVPVENGLPFLPDLGGEHRADFTILNIGKNTLSNPDGTSADVIKRTHEAFAWLSPQVKRVVVLGQFVDWDTPAVSTIRTKILETNAALKLRYGPQFVDVLGYITSPQVWIDTGITPTAEDLAQQALGNKPPSLSIDKGHFNDAGYTAVANLIAAAVAALGYY